MRSREPACVQVSVRACLSACMRISVCSVYIRVRALGHTLIGKAQVCGLSRAEEYEVNLKCWGATEAEAAEDSLRLDGVVCSEVGMATECRVLSGQISLWSM